MTPNNIHFQIKMDKLITPIPFLLIFIHVELLSVIVAGLNETTVKVVPSPVAPQSVGVKGDWDRFNISWGVSLVNHGQVYYEVLMLYQQQGRQQDMKVVSCVCFKHFGR